MPTPIHPWKGLEKVTPSSPSSSSSVSSVIDLYIKRDDLSGAELSGNKVRKLEFLVADALDKGSDALLSIGGIQSNHARAVAAASRAAGLECHLILRTRKSETEKDPGFAGNLLIERLVGSHIHLVSKEDYAAAGNGGFPLLEELGERLKEENEDKEEGKRSSAIKTPYLIPLGGSNALGAWGYVETSREIIEQAPEAIRRGREEKKEKSGGEEAGASSTADHFDVIVLATGSAGTAAGLALGLHLAGSPTKVRAYCVCDDPAYFYDEIQKHLDELCRGGGEDPAPTLQLPPPPRARDVVTVVQAKGSGYAISRPEELQFLRSVAAASGILLDPVYTGKAAKTFLEEVTGSASEWRGKKVLFLHTGGLFGLYGAAEEVVAASGMVGEGVEAFRK